MKIKNFVSVFVLVLVLAAFMAVPVFAQGENPAVDPPVFDWGVISSAFQTLLVAFLVPSAGFLARWLFAKIEFEKAMLSDQQQYAFNLFLKTCVYAAEQMNLKGAVQDKLEYVTSMAEAWLDARKLPIDLDEVRARIEAIVLEEFNLYPTAPTLPG